MSGWGKDNRISSHFSSFPACVSFVFVFVVVVSYALCLVISIWCIGNIVVLFFSFSLSHIFFFPDLPSPLVASQDGTHISSYKFSYSDTLHTICAPYWSLA